MVPLAMLVLGFARAAELPVSLPPPLPLPRPTHGGGACGAGEADCSLAGDCDNKVCVCDAWATGAHCQLLNFRTPESNVGYGLQLPGYHSWGGGALFDAGEYHLIMSFMCNHGSLAEWTTVSSIYRATSHAAEGPYTLQEMIAQPWSHNAMPVENPAGSAATSDRFLIFGIGDACANKSAWSPCYNNGSLELWATKQAEIERAAQAPCMGSEEGYRLYARSAARPAGPWHWKGAAEPLCCDVAALCPPCPGQPQLGGSAAWMITGSGGNPAPVIFPNGTTLLYVSANPCPPDWGNAASGNNCIGVLRAPHWSGPYTLANPLPVTHPESEDSFVFRTRRGYHMLTNVNNDHARCGQGVACGGHAWGVDGLHFSNLTIGAFGPAIPFTNGSVWKNAYLERPQVLLNATTGEPQTLFAGLGRSSYDDSVTWAAPFCTADDAEGACGPTGDALGPWHPPSTPPPPGPPARYFWTDGRCLATNDTDAMQCPNPPPVSTGPTCPVFLSPNCSGANSVWVVTPSPTREGEGTALVNARSGAALNIDSNSCAAGTIAHTFHSGNEIEYHNISVGGGPWQTVLKFMQDTPSRSACGGLGMCLNDGTGVARPPSRPTERVVDAQVKLASCTDPSATGWRRVFVPPPPAPSSACNFKADTSGHGNSLGPNINNVPSKEACCALCHANPACGGWTWGDTVVHGVCFLRKPGTSWYHQAGAWSGGPPPAPPHPPAHVAVSSVFSSSMVLQRDQPAALWGWTAKVSDTITVSFNGKQYHTQSASSSTAPGGALWTITLEATPASAVGLAINITCGACPGNGATLSLQDILVGDVHLCSGQSNMDFTVQQSFNGTTTEPAKADAYADKPIRILKFQGQHSRHPVEQSDFRGSWSAVNRGTIAAFSAVCWFGGRDTFDALGGAVPVGLIESDVGGTGVEFWSPSAAIAECSQATPSTKGPNGESDSTLYNGWIAPFTVGPMALKSLIWYQGESNTCPQGGGRPCGGTYYACQFAAMIRHWRLAFGNDTLPFSFVLLAPDQKENAVADIRYGQLGALSNLSNTAVVNAMDDGDCTPQYCAVHVRDKQLIGARLSAVLLGLLYRGGIGAYAPAQTPLVSNWTASSTGLTVHFKQVGSGLQIVTRGRQVVCGGNTTKWQPSDGHVISGGTNWWPINAPGRPGPSLCAGFEMQTKAGGAEWLPARPSVRRDGSSLQFVGPSGTAVTAVRYAQSDWPLVTLYTKEGQPAAPFQLPEEHFVGPH